VRNFYTHIKKYRSVFGLLLYLSKTLYSILIEFDSTKSGMIYTKKLYSFCTSFYLISTYLPNLISSIKTPRIETKLDCWGFQVEKWPSWSQSHNVIIKIKALSRHSMPNIEQKCPTKQQEVSLKLVMLGKKSIPNKVDNLLLQAATSNTT